MCRSLLLPIVITIMSTGPDSSKPKRCRVSVVRLRPKKAVGIRSAAMAPMVYCYQSSVCGRSRHGRSGPDTPVLGHILNSMVDWRVWQRSVDQLSDLAYTFRKGRDPFGTEDRTVCGIGRPVTVSGFVQPTRAGKSKEETHDKPPSWSSSSYQKRRFVLIE